MRVASIITYALMALAGVHHVSVPSGLLPAAVPSDAETHSVRNACCSPAAQEADEFDGVEAPVITPPEKTASLPEPLAVPMDDHNYLLEGGSLAIAALYAINYFVGKSQNKKIAEKWLEASEPSLVKEFSYTGSSGNPSVGLLEESKNNFKYYCTGRRFCSRFIVDMALASRHDLLTRLTHIVMPTNDHLMIDVGLNATDLDPFILSITKKTQYNDLTKMFPELLTYSKRTDTNQIPESLCIISDNIETPKTVLTPQLIKQLTALEPFLDFVVITDVNTLRITGFPKTERRMLRLRFKLRVGSKDLDAAAAIALTTHLIDAIGSTMKLSRDIKASAQKKRARWAAERGPSEDTLLEEARRLADLKEKKRLEYEKMSYEEKQKYDEIHQSRQMRKRVSRKQK